MAAYLDKAIKDEHARVTGEGKNEKITYVAVNCTERFSDPEEKVRAEFWAELIYRYGYEPQRIGIEVVVPDRIPFDRADLVVFRDNARKKPYSVVECKKDGITDAEFNQAVEQACGNGTWAKFRAEYVMVVAGATRRAFDFTDAYVDKFGVLEREQNIIADIPLQYGKPEEFRFIKGVKERDIQPTGKEELIRAIQKCHQTLWGGGRLSPPAAFGELSKIIFVKISDEQNTKRNEPYQFQIKTHESSVRLGQRIRDLYSIQREKDPEVFTETIKIDDVTLRTVVSHLEAINLNKTDLDTKGVAFEQFMDGFFKGDFGQYFTPREIIAFAVEMMKPSHDEYVLDPACGSGGFLLYSLDAVRREASSYHDEGTQEYYKHWHDFAQKRLFGGEINDEIARVAKMNMIIHDDGHTNVIGSDMLQPIERLAEQNSGFAPERFNLILTNPPFGAMIKQTEKPYLADYELSRLSFKSIAGQETSGTGTSDFKDGKKLLKQKTSVKTEILFLERCWQFLKPEGRMGIVLPDGILTTLSLQGIRDWLIERFRLVAVVSLPQFSFAHYGAAVKASLVFLQKRFPGESPSDNELTFMVATENIGYDATGRKTFKIMKSQVVGNTKIEVVQCDLFNMRFVYEKDPFRLGEWIETHREVLPTSGIVADFEKFNTNPEEFANTLTENKKANKAFTVRLFEIRKRWDVSYQTPFFRDVRTAIQNSQYPVVKLGEILQFPPVSGFAAGPSAQTDDETIGIPHIRPFNITPTGEFTLENIKYIPRENVKEADLLTKDEVLFNNTNSTEWVGKSAIFDGTVECACSNHITRLFINREKADPVFVATLLNSLRSNGLFGLLSTNFNNQAGINTETLLTLEIPLPPLLLQKKVAAEILESQNKARRLRDEAETIVSNAKMNFQQRFLK